MNILKTKICILSVCILPLNALAFKIYAPVRIQSSLVQSYTKNVIVDAYNKIGIKNAVVYYVKEAEINYRLKSGDFDAVLNKVSQESSIPNSIKISPPLIKNYTVYRWYLKGTKPKMSNITVGIIKGVIAHTKGIIKKRAIFKKINHYNTFTELFNALKENKIDSILLSPLAINNEIASMIKNKLVKIPKKLISFDIHHYIHKKHKLIQNKLSNEFLLRDKKNELNYMDYAKTYKSKNIN